MNYLCPEPGESQSHIKRRLTREQRNAIQSTTFQYNRSRYIQKIDRNTNEILKTYHNNDECADDNPDMNLPNILRACRDTDSRTAYGYRWRYVQPS